MKKGRLMVCPGEVTLTIHEPLDTGGVSRDQVRPFAEHVRDVVKRNVDEPARAGAMAPGP